MSDGVVLAQGVVATGSASGSASITGGTIDNAVIGGVTPAAGTFTTGAFTTGLFGDGTVTAPGITWTSDNDGTGTGFYKRAANVVSVSCNGVATAEIGATRYNLNSGVNIGWSSSATTVNAMDTGLARNGAGVVEVNTGVAGTLGNLAIAKVSKYNGFTTAGIGVPAIAGVGRATAQVAANASVATFTVGASDGSFEVSANVLVTTATAHAFTVTCSYTDEGNTARVLTIPFSSLAGTFLTSIVNTAGAVPYEGPVMHIRCKAATTITIGTTGTFTTVTYNVEGVIKQTA